MKEGIGLLLWIIVLTGCADSGDSRRITKITAFPVNDSIELVSMQVADSLSYPTRIYDCDSLLLFKDLSRENQVVVFSKATKRLKTIVSKGKGPNELLGAWSLSSVDLSGNFYVHDVVTSEIMRINLLGALCGPSNDAQKMKLTDYLMPVDCMVRMDDSLFLAAGRFEDCRVVQFNHAGLIKEKIGSSPQTFVDETINPMINQSYVGVLKISPNGKQYAIACRYADQIEVFHAGDTTQSLFIKGPVLFEPQVKVIKGNVGLTEECQYGYVDLAVTDEWIIGLFSGRGLKEKRANQGNILHVFKWDGTPVARYVMDQDCISIDIWQVDKMLYTLSIAPLPEIFSFKMDE